MRVAGRIKSWDENARFGFIEMADGSEVFAHYLEMAPGITPHPGESATFLLETEPSTGRHRAANIKIERER